MIIPSIPFAIICVILYACGYLLYDTNNKEPSRRKSYGKIRKETISYAVGRFGYFVMVVSVLLFAYNGILQLITL